MAVFALLALARVAWLGGPRARRWCPASPRRRSLVAAFCGVLAPWTIRNAIVLDRFVPVTTGGGKALFVATYLPGDGRQQLVKRQLIERYYGKHDLPLHRGLGDPDGAAARPGREAVPGPAAATPRWRASGARTSSKYADRAAARLRVDGDPAKIRNMWDRGSSPAMSPDSGSPTTACSSSGRWRADRARAGGGAGRRCRSGCRCSGSRLRRRAAARGARAARCR